jgi:hypothetical protein
MLDLSTVRLGFGNHSPTKTPTGNRDMCLMEAVAFMAGEEWTSYPRCACDMTAFIIRTWQDALSDEARDRLLPADVWVPRLMGSSTGSLHVSNRRKALLADWLLRSALPEWLRLFPEFQGHAECLENLPIIPNMANTEKAKGLLRKLRTDFNSFTRTLPHNAHNYYYPEFVHRSLRQSGLAGVALSLNASTGNAAIPLAVDSVYWCTNVASLLKLDTANAEGAVQQSLLETLEAVLAVREA